MKFKVAFAASIALFLPACATPQVSQPAIAITVDDLPLHGPTPRGETAVSVAQGVISALTAEHVPAYGFINGHWVAEQPETAGVLNAWRAAGLSLGNHGWSHLHLSEITVWALFYFLRHALTDLASAWYFSAVTYTTTGYGDLVLPQEWRLVGGVEALTGILMCGWSTGFFFAVVSRMYEARPETT